MGYPNHELVPAAILLDNPGITKEQFVTLLNDTRIYSGDVDQRSSWDLDKLRIYRPSYLAPELLPPEPPSGFDDIPRPEGEVEEFHLGLHGLGSILRLPATKKFLTKVRAQEITDEFNLPHGGPYFKAHTKFAQGSYDSPFFTLWRSLGYARGEKTQFGKRSSEQPLQKGDVVIGYDVGRNGKLICSAELFTPFGAYVVERIVKATPKNSHVETVMKVREVLYREQTERFATVEELTKKYPHFAPEVMYDFSKEKGKLATRFGEYYWKMCNGKYYLDEKMFDKIPPPSNWLGFLYGYSSLVLTAEALRNKAWKLLTYKGLRHKEDFFRDFPEAIPRFSQAVWDAQTSEAAKQSQMSITDFLRWRASMRSIM